MLKLLCTCITMIAIVIPSIALDYYWVGEGGNWSDLSHWATTSGGSVFHSQVPSSEDRIILDQNSFDLDGQEIIFNSDIIFFSSFSGVDLDQDITISGGENVIVSSFGSLDLGLRVAFLYEGIINFTGGSLGNSINFGNNIAAQSIYIAGDGEWTLSGALEVDSILQISEGTFRTDGNDIRCQFLNIIGDSPKVVDLSFSNIEVWGKYGQRYEYTDEFDTISMKIHTTNLDLDAGTSTINLTASETEVRFSGNSPVQLYNASFTHALGRNYLRPRGSAVDVTWNTLQLLGSTRMEGNHEIANLVLSGNKVYRLQSRKDFEIQNIDAVGNCAEGIVITSSLAGIAVNVECNGPINVDFAILRDINAIGGPFNATNSTDLGNNTNWNFTNSSSVDYFWIGGSGNWTDPNHWSLTSGGSSSGCLPFGKDNAYFDQNSFTGPNQIVSIDLEDVFIHDMLWNGATNQPTLDGQGEKNMHITGSLRFDQGMNHLFQGDYFFESSDVSNSIETNGNKFNKELHFSGQDAAWNLLDDVYVDAKLSHHSGTLNTGGNDLDVFQYESKGSSRRRLNLINSYVLVRDMLNENDFAVYRPEWNVETENYNAQTEGSTIEFQSSFYAGFLHAGPDNAIAYNKVIFSSYGGDVYSQNWNDELNSMAIVDSMIFRGRGLFTNSQEINYLELAAGYDYNFSSGLNQFIINELNANGTCADGSISISVRDVGRPANFYIDNDHVLTNVVVQDIHNHGTGNLQANASIDRGNNVGWDIQGGVPRTLYWVGNTGAWEDESHWSLTSGGVGGECVPLPFDDVVFDHNSFTMANQSVYSDNNRLLQCHDMTWVGVFGHPTFGSYYDPILEQSFGTDGIKISGSLQYDSQMTLRIYWHYFTTAEVDSVITNGIELSGIQMLGYGTIHFLDDLTNFNFDHNNGVVIMEGINWFTNHYNAFNFNDERMSSSFTNVNIHVGRKNHQEATFSNSAENHEFILFNSTIFLDAPITHLVSSVGADYERIISTDPQGIVYIGDRFLNGNKFDFPDLSASFIELAGDGYFLGTMNTDTLIGSVGNVYTLEQGETTTVNNYLRLIGNNCTPILLRSSQSGIAATISMPPGSTNIVNFIEMRDNTAIGGADFVAGSRSTNVASSNVGWLFEDPPEFVETGFLGVDRTLCSNGSITLSAFNFSPGESYQWSNGQTDKEIVVSETGMYDVNVTFHNGCSVTDQIRILEPQDFKVDFVRSDSIICAGNEIEIVGRIDFQGVDYQWSDNVTTPNRILNQAGEYILTAEVDGCTSTDTFNLQVQAIPEIDLGSDFSICEDEKFSLTPQSDPGTLIWMDGNTESTFEIDTGGYFWAEVEMNQCRSRDSVLVSYVVFPIVDIGPDSILCEGATLLLTAETQLGVIYSWQDGSQSDVFEVSESGTYILTGDNTGCRTRDTVEIQYQEAIVLDLGNDKEACESEELILMPMISADTYLWSTGDSTEQIIVSNSGTYKVSIVSGVCAAQDSIEVIFNQYPTLELGVGDTTLCENQELLLSAGQLGMWQDGTIADSYQVSTGGMYSVVLDNNGCQVSDSIEVGYQSAPIIQLGEDQEACEGSTLALNVGVVADVYNWNTGASTEEVQVNVSGTYKVSVESGVCSAEDSIEVVFNSYPTLELGTNDTTLCEGQTLQLLAGQSGMWQDGTTADRYQVSTAGLYSVLLDNRGCQVSDSVEVAYQSAPIIQLGEDQEACEGSSVTLNSGVVADTYNWNTGASTEEIQVNVSGTYFVSVVEGVCARADSISIVFNSYPQVNLANGMDSVAICEGEVLRLDAMQEGLWQDGSMGQSFDVVISGEYIVVLDNQGCKSGDTVNVDVFSRPVVNLGSDTSICEGNSLVLNVSADLVDFIWEDGSMDPNRMISTDGVYWVEAIENGCAGTDSIVLAVNSNPTIELGLDTTVCKNEGFELNVLSSEGIITWFDGSVGDKITITEPTLVTATIDNGCVSSDSVMVDFRPCIYFEVYFPNIFSPNADGTNDSFKPSFSSGVDVISYEFRIFDRWGSEVFASTDVSDGWEGYMNNNEVDPGIYVYFMEIIYQDDVGEARKTVGGDVMVVN